MQTPQHTCGGQKAPYGCGVSPSWLWGSWRLHFCCQAGKNTCFYPCSRLTGSVLLVLHFSCPPRAAHCSMCYRSGPPLSVNEIPGIQWRLLLCVRLTYLTAVEVLKPVTATEPVACKALLLGLYWNLAPSPDSFSHALVIALSAVPVLTLYLACSHTSSYWINNSTLSYLFV